MDQAVRYTTTPNYGASHQPYYTVIGLRQIMDLCFLNVKDGIEVIMLIDEPEVFKDLYFIVWRLRQEKCRRVSAKKQKILISI